jgi:hypothetical protein
MKTREVGMIYRFFLITLVALGWAGCQDIEEFIPDTLPQPFNASVFVKVTDPSGQPVDGASVVLGNRVGQTDQYGVLYIRQVPMTPVSYAQVSRAGYFQGSRRFYPGEGKTHHIHIILTPQTEVGTFYAGTGGVVSLDARTTLTFPADAIADASGAPYSGLVSVLAYAIHADDPELSEKMPGDLVGRSNEGTLGALGSLGMLAVELYDASGAPLQVKAGSKVEMRMDVPADMLDNAPMTIPMWFFSEEAGVWIEQGLASLDGGAYVAEVGHFTYWNYDAWFPIVKWGATFVYENGAPADQLQVCITILSLETTKCDVTNSEGTVCGMVAAGETLLMEVKDPCGNVIYSQQIGPYSDTTMIGPITLPTAAVEPVQVSGLAVDCNGDPVTEGFALIEAGEAEHFAELDPVTGAFSAAFINCDGLPVTVRVVDAAALKESTPATFPNAPVIDAGTITVCDQLAELIDLEFPDFPGVHYYFFFPDADVESLTTTISAIDSSANHFFFVRLPGTSPGTYTPTGTEIGLWMPNAAWGYANGVSVTITQFGGPGEFITGTLTGTMYQQGGSYPMTGTFVVRND